jgi:hypothetical protein
MHPVIHFFAFFALRSMGGSFQNARNGILDALHQAKTFFPFSSLFMLIAFASLIELLSITRHLIQFSGKGKMGSQTTYPLAFWHMATRLGMLDGLLSGNLSWIE